MKTRRLSTLFLTAALLVPAGASAEFRNTRVVSAPAIVADVLLLRPFGFALSAVGTAFFVGTLPLTGIANIAPPNDAIERTANALVRGPIAFTFNRPLGEMSYQPSGIYPVRPGEPLGSGFYSDGTYDGSAAPAAPDAGVPPQPPRRPR
jgi:hypothetical protein